MRKIKHVKKTIKSRDFKHSLGIFLFDYGKGRFVCEVRLKISGFGKKWSGGKTLPPDSYNNIVNGLGNIVALREFQTVIREEIKKCSM